MSPFVQTLLFIIIFLPSVLVLTAILYSLYKLYRIKVKNEEIKFVEYNDIPSYLALLMIVTGLSFIVYFIIKNGMYAGQIFSTFIMLIAQLVLYIKFSISVYKPQEAKIVTFYKKDSTKTVLSSFAAILIGLLIGAFILLILAGKKIGGTEISFKAAIEAIQLIFLGAFNLGRTAEGTLVFGWNGVNIGDMLFRATPLILTGLSVAVAFKTGLFNIGAPGQYLMGTAASLIVALSIPTSAVPAFFVWVLAFLAAIIAGFLWGLIPGAFKALLNVNEVITCIMTNWIAANLVTTIFNKETGIFKHLLDPSGTKNNAYLYKTTHNGVETAKLGLDKIFAGSQINAGILVALLIAVVIYIILNKTTLGFELKACGSNRHASEYAGIKSKRSIMLSMGIAGGLAAAGAALYYLSGNTEFAWETYQKLPAIGFNGIPVALLAVNNPLGVTLSAIFMAYLDVAGLQIKGFTTYNEHITSIIAAIIVYFSAFSLVIKQALGGSLFKRKKKKSKKEEVTE